MPRGTQVKRGELSITVERRGSSRKIALRHRIRPQLHVQSAKDYTGRETAPRGVGFRGRTLKTIRTEGVWGSPHKRPNYTRGNRGINNCGGQSINFLLDTGATYSVLTEAPGPVSSRSTSITRLSGRAKTYYFSVSVS